MELMRIVFFVSLLCVALGAIVKKVESIFLTEPFIAMVCGIIVGPNLLNFIHATDQATELNILGKVCEFTIALALMASALRIPNKFYIKGFLTQSLIVFWGMILMWLSAGALLYWALGLSIPECLLIGAIITPTDPVVSSTIVTGEKAKKYLPAKLRNTISFEAGANDGLAFPFVILTVSLLHFTDFSLSHWVTKTVFYDTILCGGISYVLGYLAGLTLNKAHKAGMMRVTSVLPFSVALSLLLLAALELMGMNGIVGVFIGGLAFSRHISKNETFKEVQVQESMERLFTIPVFFIFGLIIPWQAWLGMGWHALSIVVLILLFRRIPGFLLLRPFLPMFKSRTKEVLLMGWFGPIAVAALYYAILSIKQTSLEKVWVIPSLIVFSSTIVHGVSSLPIQKWYFDKSSNQKKN